MRDRQKRAHHAPGHLFTLPIQVRPVAGEGFTSFIERLAAANHLKAGHLRTYLCGPPLHRGHPRWERLAAVTGREPQVLREILENTRCTECGGLLPITPVGSPRRQRCSQACRQKSYRKRHPKPRKQRAVACTGCGQHLTVAPGGETRRWCSASCREKGFRQRQREEPDALAAPTQRATPAAASLKSSPGAAGSAGAQSPAATGPTYSAVWPGANLLCPHRHPTHHRNPTGSLPNMRRVSFRWPVVLHSWPQRPTVVNGWEGARPVGPLRTATPSAKQGPAGSQSVFE
jgi:hypothetical protein